MSSLLKKSNPGCHDSKLFAAIWKTFIFFFHLSWGNHWQKGGNLINFCRVNFKVTIREMQPKYFCTAKRNHHAENILHNQKKLRVRSTLRKYLKKSKRTESYENLKEIKTLVQFLRNFVADQYFQKRDTQDFHQNAFLADDLGSSILLSDNLHAKNAHGDQCWEFCQIQTQQLVGFKAFAQFKIFLIRLTWFSSNFF